MKPEMKPSCSRALVRPTRQVKENSANTGTPKNTAADRISRRRPSPADTRWGPLTVKQRVHVGLVLHYEKEEEENEAQDDHPHPQDGERSVEKRREAREESLSLGGG